MKKSEIYRKAMLVIVDSMKLSAEDKLEILEVLAENESTAKWCEKREDTEE